MEPQKKGPATGCTVDGAKGLSSRRAKEQDNDATNTEPASSTDIQSAAIDQADRYSLPLIKLKGKAPAPHQSGEEYYLDPDTWEPTRWVALDYRQARKWMAQGGNVGVVCGDHRRILVVDVDGPHPDGLELTDTVTVKTGKGYHHFYRVPDGVELPKENTTGKIAPKVDTKGHMGYVVFPGSIHPDTGTMYTFEPGKSFDDLSIADLPPKVIEALQDIKTPTKADKVELPSGTVTNATPADQRRGAKFLEAACNDVAASTPGTRNNTLYRKAYKMGVYAGYGYFSESEAARALLDAAPLDKDFTEGEARQTIKRAIEEGVQNPDALPDRTPTPAPENVTRFPKGTEDTSPHMNNEEEAPQAPAREYLPLDDWGDIDTLLDMPIINVFEEGLKLGTLGVMAAAGGTGKSFLSLEIALSVALGRKLVDGFTPDGPGRVLCAFGEDDRQIVIRRLRDISDGLGVPWKEARACLQDGQLTTIAGRSEPLLAPDTITGKLTPTNAYKELKERCSQDSYKLIIIDPLISWAGLDDENSNAAMQQASRILIELAEASGGAVLVLHHTNKAGNRSGEHSQDNARGASSLGNASRWAISMRTLDEKDAQDRGIPPEEAVNYCQTFITKNSYAVRDGRVNYLHRNRNGVLESVDLANTMPEKIALALADTIRELDAHLIKWEISRGEGPKGKKVKSIVEGVMDRKVSVQELKKAIDFGLDHGILISEEPTPRASGRKRLEILPGNTPNTM